MKDHVTTEEAAKIIGCNASRVRQLMQNGLLKGEKVGRDWLVEQKSAEAYRDTERKPGRKPKKPATEKTRKKKPTEGT